jgi:hypothetical protein
MNENLEQRFEASHPAEPVGGEDVGAPVTASVPETRPQGGPGNGVDGPAGPPSWHVAAGRKGAQRIHQLIQQGKLYEQEHGLKSGRQRLRQLIEEGKLYEQEHGLPAPRQRARRPPRRRGEQLLADLLRTMLRLVKPSVRGQVLRLIQTLEAEEKVGGESLD